MVPVPNDDFIYQYVAKNPNTTYFAIKFDKKAGTPINYRYQLWYNSTTVAGSEGDVFGIEVLSYMRAIDEAIGSLTSF